MELKPYNLPDPITDEILDSTRLKRILSLYSEVAQTEVDATEGLTDENANDLADEFAGQQLLVAYDEDGAVVGVVNYDDDSRQNQGWIEGLVVDKKHRGFKIGQAIVGQLVERARANGRDTIGLRSLPSAVGFYERLGFTLAPGNEAAEKPVMHLPIDS